MKSNAVELRLARLVESGFCEATDSKVHEHELLRLIEETSRGHDLASESEFFKALADETRLKILYALFQGEMCECEIMAALGMSQPGASHHLSILQHARIVAREKRGKWVFYRVSNSALNRILSLVSHKE